MAKKSKNSSKKHPSPQKPHENPNIFNQLFGDDSALETAENPLFSVENPFRRKPTDSIPPNSQIPENPNPNSNPKKRNNEKSSNLAEISTENVQLDAKKSKLERNPNLGIDNGGESNVGSVQLEGMKFKNENVDQNPNLGIGNEEREIGKKKKEKRKRDELEREYEARKYGVVAEDMEEEGRRDKMVAAVGKKRKAVDNPAEMMVNQEEGYDDENKLLRTVFIGNLPLKVKKKVLVREFSQFGEIESVRIRSVPTLDGKKPKKVQVLVGKINEAADSVHAYVVFKTEQAAAASLAHNMSVVEGNHIRVDRACPPRKKLKADNASAPVYSSKRTIFVGNLPFDVKDEELYQLFCGMKEIASSVEGVRVVRDRATSLGKGIAYVLFKTREAANLVCKKRHLKIRDRELRLCHAKSENQSTPSKRKNPPAGDSESTPAKKFLAGAKSPEGRYKVNTKGDTSYQGLRTSKSGEKKRTPSRSHTPAPFKSGPKKVDKVKQRSEKRPSVAARKAKDLAQKGIGIPKQTGNKRKMEARTPQSSNKKKKFKNSK